MSERLILRAFREPDAKRFTDVFAMVVARNGGEVHWLSAQTNPREDLRTARAEDVQTVFLPYLGGASGLLCVLVGAALDVPWVEIRIQEGSLWDYSLYIGAKHVDQFSTLPEYWDDDNEQASQKDLGDAALLSRVWNVPKERIERYLRHWGMEYLDEGLFDTKLKGKAYDSDMHEYGSIYQMFDFLRALGAADPVANGVIHRIVIPPLDTLRNAVGQLNGGN